MPAFSASAPGKVILFGEHAVVYGQPAIAVPVHAVTAKATVTADIIAPSGRVLIEAPDVQLSSDLDSLRVENPLAAAVHSTLRALGVARPPAFKLRITSTIPVASGLGSGAAVSVAIVRAVSAFLGQPLPNQRVSDLAFEVEKLHHGTPSGIDNTVIAFAKAVYFVKGQPLQTLKISAPFHLLIADTGIASPTRNAVGDVRAAWQREPERYDSLFSEIGGIATKARVAIESGDTNSLGPLMDANHTLLQQLTVSSPQLDALVSAAKQADALGAKLSGGGRGGNMIALVDQQNNDAVAAALKAAGAVTVIATTVEPS